jgi:hypothetical protein
LTSQTQDPQEIVLALLARVDARAASQYRPVMSMADQEFTDYASNEIRQHKLNNHNVPKNIYTVIIWISASYPEFILMIPMKYRPPYLSYIPHILSTYLYDTYEV